MSTHHVCISIIMLITIIINTIVVHVNFALCNRCYRVFSLVKYMYILSIVTKDLGASVFCLHCLVIISYLGY